MTNADVIRQMTDEELYKLLQAIEVGDIDYSLTFCSLCKKDNQLDCDECFKRWLFNDAHDYNGLLKGKGINSGYAKRIAEQTEPQTDEPTWEQVKEYCNKRCLDIVDSALRKKWYKDEPQTDCAWK